jgi:hypothetical protein
MDGHRFDRFAQSLSRRSALKRAGKGGLAAGLAGALGAAAVGPGRAAAQDAADGEDAVCLLPFEAKVRSGPNAGYETTGHLAFRLTPDGAIDRGVLVEEDGNEVEVVGQAVGRAITLIFAVQDGRYLFGTGGSTETIADVCAASAAGLYAEVPALGGPFAGPEAGDIGDWLVCCCPSVANDFDCGPRPECPHCGAPPSGGGGYTNPGCLSGCNAVDGGGVLGCQESCTLQG